MTKTIETTQEAILDAAIRHVPFDGWSLSAWTYGATDVGIDGAGARRLYPGNPGAMMSRHSQILDRRMLAALEKRGLDNLRVRERITAAVRVRLELAAGDREAVRRGVSLMATPFYAPLATRLLYRTVDAMWLAAGDASTDYNHYTKRALLAGVYGAVVLYWLNDRSEGCADTWSFLDRRIADVMKAPKLLSAPGRILKRMPLPSNLFRRRSKFA
jgi:ubiquinone biosynthesis protein COQ9